MQARSCGDNETLHSVRSGTLGGRLDSLEKKALLSIYWRLRVWGQICLCLERTSSFSVTTFVAVVVDIDIEPVDVIRCSNRHEKQYESKVKYAHSIALPR